MSVAIASRAGAGQPELPFPASPPAPSAALSLLAEARRGLAEAEDVLEPVPRFIASYLAALRAGAAVLSARGRPHRGRARPASVWVLLESAAPELGEWAAFFAANSAAQAAAQAGITRRITTRAADDLLRQAGQFLEIVDRVVRGGRASGFIPAQREAKSRRAGRGEP
ncbi:MAG TPA: SAV_6107 family HEPN domain-containing protein [Amycolatopsis sp.]|uniref:SAV_6107 family HEPN domain-containing protein n=1 Tax=Amycolatopsis sp. TaxID=37632 RepID=UPI002B48439F|nr:SAV_6107 family HEPN domain-containing protein [Amycolatopsis sp.]HKS48721.1 SAV_6107 family HEPN domain-containing protein [Amycolatopsis sp.]